MQLGTFVAQVLVDGEALEEHDVVSESPTKATCWIPSEEGKSFSVQWKCHEQIRPTASQGDLYVDGIGCGLVLMWPGKLGTRDTESLSCHIGTTTTRDLMFSRVQLSDDDSLLNKEVPKTMGQICLDIRRGKEVKVALDDDDTSEDSAEVLGDNKFHERTKKATVHCIGFGAEVPRQRLTYVWDMVPNDEPVMTFVFNYQPLAMLQANGIAPRPAPNDASVDLEADSSERRDGTPANAASEDIKPFQLDDRIQDLENELKRLRDMKASNPEDRRPKRVKKELDERRRPLFAPGEIIDLT